MQYSVTSQWQQFIARPEQDWSLLEAALLISQQLQPAVEFHSETVQDNLRALQQELQQRIPQPATDAARLQILNDYFFDELGFCGNSADFFAEQNSFIDKVIEHRSGIPISLSLLYMEFASSIGLQLDGVNFPGHFLVRLCQDNDCQYLDTYNRGQVLEAQELEDLLSRHKVILQHSSELAEYLSVASKSDILVRMLRNLKNIYIEQQNSEKALLVIELILSINSQAIDEIRDRGMIYHYLDYTAGALKDLQTYLSLQSDGSEHQIIQSLVESLEEQTTILH